MDLLGLDSRNPRPSVVLEEISGTELPWDCNLAETDFLWLTSDKNLAPKWGLVFLPPLGLRWLKPIGIRIVLQNCHSPSRCSASPHILVLRVKALLLKGNPFPLGILKNDTRGSQPFSLLFIVSRWLRHPQGVPFFTWWIPYEISGI